MCAPAVASPGLLVTRRERSVSTWRTEPASRPTRFWSQPAVGLTEAQARAAGTRVRTVAYEIGNVAGASLHADGYTGRAQLVIDEERQVIVGATFLGQDVADLLHSATVALVGEVPLDRLWHAVPAYPTISEVWLRLLETYRRTEQ